MEFAEICIFSGQPIWSQCSLSMTSENEANVPFLYPLKTSEKQFFLLFQGVWRTTFDPKWVCNLITFQEINFHPSKEWSNSKMFYHF